MKRVAVCMAAVMFTMSGCASWCNNSDDYQKCMDRVNTAQKVAIVTAVVVTAGAAVYAVNREARHGGGGGYSDNSYSTNSYHGNCQYSWQHASDGSICGDRAASVRPGGY